MNRFIATITCLLIAACSIAPGMHMNESNNMVYIDGELREINLTNINNAMQNFDINEAYRIGNGDQISITVWGLPDIFPITNINVDQNLRRVDSKGNIYFPYVGMIRAANKTQEELRDDLSRSLSDFFTEPQLDVSIARFNSQKVYLLGEVTTPKKLFITDIPLSLTEALGESNGLNTNTSNASEVFIIRKGEKDTEPKIYIANLSSPSGFIDAGRFYLKDNDVIYVNAKGTTRWNRVISQFFPFSSFLNSVDNLVSSD